MPGPEVTPGVALPSDVGLLPNGEALYFTQRDPGRPMVDCMFAALCTPLSYMGLRLPADFPFRLRIASGVPDFDAKGEPQGTTTRASQRAIRRIFRELPGLYFGTLTEADLLDGIADGEYVARVMSNTKHLPPRLKRWVGRSWDGGHAVAIGDARQTNGAWEVFWMDPAGRPKRGYRGEWVAWADVKASLKKTNGRYIVAVGDHNALVQQASGGQGGHGGQGGGQGGHGGQGGGQGGHGGQGGEGGQGGQMSDSNSGHEHGSAVEGGEDQVQILTGAVPDQFARISDRTALFHPSTLRRVTRVDGDADFRLAGRSLDGKYTGVWVRTSQVRGATGFTLLLAESASVGVPFVRGTNQ